MSSPSFTMSVLLSLSLFSFFAFLAQAQVPANETFKFVNDQEFGPYIVEYDGSYRMLSIFASPFQFAFYNTTPNAFTLALRMGLTRSESLFRWVWEANRGNPVAVGENATLTFGTNGNLVLADADGRVAWQTNTASKGVVGLKLLPTGNLVLYNSKGVFVWQSFDYPTDTLLVGQSLKAGGVNKLVSRLSETENKDGPYSLVMEPKGLAMYYKSPNSPKPLLYFSFYDRITAPTGTLDHATLNVADTDDGFAYDITLDYQIANTTNSGGVILARPKYNSTSTFLRLGIDGNVKFYTYNDKVDYGAWEVTFRLFDRDNFVWEQECQLPERCGSFGVCEDSQCVACPSSSGVLLGWSKTCAAEKLTSCDAKSFHYYKIEGVDHFLSKFTTGSATKEADCGKKCTSDCKCLGYFYNRDSSRCWIAYELKTLTKVANSTHVGYIKAPNH